MTAGVTKYCEAMDGLGNAASWVLGKPVFLQ